MAFRTYPAAPAMIASKSASSSANEVSIRHLMSSSCERISRQTSTPLPSGSRTSSTATSGRVAGIRTRASARRARLADDLDVVLDREQLVDATPDHFVVIEQEYRDFSVFAHDISLTRSISSLFPSLQVSRDNVPLSRRPATL